MKQNHITARKPRVISQHLDGEPRIIKDLPGQVFLLPGAEPEPVPVEIQPVQIALFDEDNK